MWFRHKKDGIEVDELILIRVIGSAKQLIKIFSLEGEQLGIITYYPYFMAQKIGPVSCLAFHPYQVLLAVGAADAFASIYADDNSQTDEFNCNLAVADHSVHLYRHDIIVHCPNSSSTSMGGSGSIGRQTEMEMAFPFGVTTSEVGRGPNSPELLEHLQWESVLKIWESRLAKVYNKNVFGITPPLCFTNEHEDFLVHAMHYKMTDMPFLKSIVDKFLYNFLSIAISLFSCTSAPQWHAVRLHLRPLRLPQF
ncbi:hypothetical protein PS1_033222 [Malus domestica]